MLEEIGLFSLTADRMHYLTERQNVVAQNIANADTPGYQAQDVAPFTFDQTLVRGIAGSQAAGSAPPLALVATNPADFASPASVPYAVQASPAAATYGEKPDGNTVSLEEQMVKQSDIADGFALATAAYSKSISIMKIGIDNK